MNGNNGNKNAIEGIIFSILGVAFMMFWIYKAIKGGAYAAGILFGGFGLFNMVRNLIYQIKSLKNKDQYGEYPPYQHSSSQNYNPADSGCDPWDAEYPRYSGQYDADMYNGPVTIGSGKNFCPYCGIPIKADHSFCKNCGRQLDE